MTDPAKLTDEERAMWQRFNSFVPAFMEDDDDECVRLLDAQGFNADDPVDVALAIGAHEVAELQKAARRRVQRIPPGRRGILGAEAVRRLPR